MTRNINYEFVFAGSLEQMINDDPDMEARLQVFLRMFIRDWYGDIADDVKCFRKSIKVPYFTFSNIKGKCIFININKQ